MRVPVNLHFYLDGQCDEWRRAYTTSSNTFPHDCVCSTDWDGSVEWRIRTTANTESGFHWNEQNISDVVVVVIQHMHIRTCMCRPSTCFYSINLHATLEWSATSDRSSHEHTFATASFVSKMNIHINTNCLCGCAVWPRHDTLVYVSFRRLLMQLTVIINRLVSCLLVILQNSQHRQHIVTSFCVYFVESWIAQIIYCIQSQSSTADLKTCCWCSQCSFIEFEANKLE